MIDYDLEIELQYAREDQGEDNRDYDAELKDED